MNNQDMEQENNLTDIDELCNMTKNYLIILSSQ